MLFVNHMRYECCAGGTTCNEQRSLFSTVGGLGGTLSFLVVPGQSPDRDPRGEAPEALEILQFTLAKNTKNTHLWSIYPKLQFHEFY